MVVEPVEKRWPVPPRGRPQGSGAGARKFLATIRPRPRAASMSRPREDAVLMGGDELFKGTRTLAPGQMSSNSGAFAHLHLAR